MRLLVVSERFGPNAGIGGVRIGAFVKNFPRCSVSSVVLCGTSTPVPDEVNLAALFPEVMRSAGPDVHAAIRASTVLRLPNDQPVRLARRLQQRFPRSTGMRNFTLGALARRVASAYYFYTFGEYQMWVRRAIARGLHEAARQPFDAVVATLGNEYWNFEVAHVLGRKLRLPVVLDFRDEWDRFFQGTARAAGQNPRAGGRRSRIFPLMHRYVRNCALATCATESVAARLNEFWPKVPAIVINNGFDLVEPADEAPASLEDSSTPFVLAHLGSFWHNDHWPKFADAVVRLAASGPVSIVYRGRTPELFEAELRGYGYPPNVRFDVAGMASRSEVQSLVRRADVLIASVPSASPGAIPSKIYDAIGLLKPLLILGDRHAAHVIDHMQHCPSPWFVVDTATTIEAIVDYLRRAPSQPIEAPERRFRYSAEARTHELVDALSSLVPTAARIAVRASDLSQRSRKIA